MNILILGGAGLVGQNLVVRLKVKGYESITVIDKNKNNLKTLKELHSFVTVIEKDISRPGEWEEYVRDADVVVMLQAQIGGLYYKDFKRNNIDSTNLVLNILKKHPEKYLVHVSSSVVESAADDFYTNSKKEQERAVKDSGIPCPILRPTLMFGWFDRKHLGWLSRFLQRVPVFPIPGNGRYMRQPLYVGDFCNVIISCIENKIKGGIYNITGREKVDYIDIIKIIKKTIRANTLILKIPYSLFYALLWIWALFDKNPPFTIQQLSALVAKDEFEVIDWPGIFGVENTDFEKAIDETFNHERYSKVVLEF